jgi:hypothetical protein
MKWKLAGTALVFADQLARYSEGSLVPKLALAYIRLLDVLMLLATPDQAVPSTTSGEPLFQAQFCNGRWVSQDKPKLLFDDPATRYREIPAIVYLPCSSIVPHKTQPVLLDCLINSG